MLSGAPILSEMLLMPAGVKLDHGYRAIGLHLLAERTVMSELFSPC